MCVRMPQCLPDFHSSSYISGNIFVIAAIVLERNLQGVANYLILSLAVADLLVAVLVMPLAAVYEVRNIYFLTEILTLI